MKLNEIVLLEEPMVALVNAADIEKWKEWKAIRQDLTKARVKISKKFNDMKTDKRFFTDGGAENRLTAADWEQGTADLKRAQDTARMSFNRTEVFTNSKFDAQVFIDSSSRGYVLGLRVPRARSPI